MNKMLFLSAALAALLASPAMAQDHHGGHDRGSHGSTQGAPQTSAPAAAAPAAGPAGQSHRSSDWHGRGNSSGPGPAMRRDNDNHDRGSNDHDWRNNSHRDNNWRNNSHRDNSNDWRGNDRGIGNGSHNWQNRGAAMQHHDWRSYNRNYRAPRRFHAPRYHRPSGWYSHRWTFGEILPSLFWGQQYWLSDYGIYDLPPPPAGAVWVRNGNDALLIDRYTGEVITVEYDVFY